MSYIDFMPQFAVYNTSFFYRFLFTHNILFILQIILARFKIKLRLYNNLMFNLIIHMFFIKEKVNRFSL